jgi:uncharacterized metal-binding protein YceD (DUF177 family)
MTVQPEFSRRVALAEIGAQPRSMVIEANEAERAALASRFGILALDGLAATVEIAAAAKGIEARGSLTGRLTQNCVASGLPVAQEIAEGFLIRFEPPHDEGLDEEIELSAEDCDVMEHDGLAIDLGEAVAQTLALAIDPFPRSENADQALKDAGILGEEDTSPFAKLKSLFNKAPG